VSKEAFEESRTQGNPDALYLFSVGGRSYPYTDYERELTIEGITYQPIAIDRDSINTSGTLDKSQLRVRMPRSEDIPQLFRIFPPSDVVSLIIYEGHHEDPDLQFLCIWSGRVLGCGHQGTTAELTCEPVSTSLRRSGLRRRWQYTCPLVLYGAECGLNKDDHFITTTASAMQGAYMSFSAGWNGSYDAARFVGGVVSWTYDGAIYMRSILKVDAANNKLLLDGVVQNISVGASVKVYLGCAHTLSACTELGNILNFGGQESIPKQNPIGYANRFF